MLFRSVSELCRMGAQIEIDHQIAKVYGGKLLSGAEVEAFDIRAAAALAIAALGSEGTTRVHETHHMRRGYENFDQKLRGLGADIFFRQDDTEDFLFVGC